VVRHSTNLAEALTVVHAVGLTVLGKKVLWVLEAGVARHAATPSVLREMAQAGVVAKLCLVLDESLADSFFC
jgi:hypothetical protein